MDSACCLLAAPPSCSSCRAWLLLLLAVHLPVVLRLTPARCVVPTFQALVTGEREQPSVPRSGNAVPGTGTRERFRSYSVKLHPKCHSSFLDSSFRFRRSRNSGDYVPGMPQCRTPHSLPAASAAHLLAALCRACRNAPAACVAHLPGWP
jgi:hypothetical protein